MEREWRCTRCEKLLGVMEGDRLHIRLARGHEYLVGFPATGVCRSCRTLNELSTSRNAGANGGTQAVKVQN
jgi:phage FluMu protein Com